MTDEDIQDRRMADLMNTTLQKLGESISHQSAVSINTIQVPEFNGYPNEDIHDFLKKFKLQTLTLSDKYRCQTLVRSLKGSASTWAKTNIKGLINIGDWKGIKSALINRYEPLDKQIRYRQKLSELKFDDKTFTISAYVETYIATHLKAFPNQSDNDAIQSLRWNLPDHIIKGLNQMDDGWVKYETIPKLYDLTQRYERNILPFEPSQETESNSLNAETLKKLLTEFKESISSTIQKKAEDNEQNSKQLALITNHRPSRPVNEDKYRYQVPKHHQSNYNQRAANGRNYNQRQNYGKNYRNYNANYKPAYQRPNFPTKRTNNYQPTRQVKIEANTQSGNRSTRAQEEFHDPARAYYEKFGKPPGPCKHCQGNHLNRHCPLTMPDLN